MGKDVFTLFKTVDDFRAIGCIVSFYKGVLKITEIGKSGEMHFARFLKLQGNISSVFRNGCVVTLKHNSASKTNPLFYGSKNLAKTTLYKQRVWTFIFENAEIATTFQGMIEFTRFSRAKL